MWEITEASDEEVGSLDITPIRKLKESSGNSLSDDLDTIIRSSLTRIFPRIQQYVHVVTMNEIETEHFPPNSILVTRDRQFIYTDSTLYPFESLHDIEEKYHIRLAHNSVPKNVSIITGNPASQGSARGKARRIMGYKHMADFQDGEILVSPMTMPDFTPVMKKAAAIIADEGGVTCHAAIISRELGISCIVGTKIATSVLKNGDFVEVDATNGVVRIVRKY